MTLDSAKDGLPWGFLFRYQGGKQSRWHPLDKGAVLSLEPIGTLDFSVSVNDGASACRAGEALSVHPFLYTGDGLLIERAYRGRDANSPFNAGCLSKIILVGEKGNALDSAPSGFA